MKRRNFLLGLVALAATPTALAITPSAARPRPTKDATCAFAVESGDRRIVGTVRWVDIPTWNKRDGSYHHRGWCTVLTDHTAWRGGHDLRGLVKCAVWNDGPAWDPTVVEAAITNHTGAPVRYVHDSAIPALLRPVY